jgi:hypothetical protein
MHCANVSSSLINFALTTIPVKVGEQQRTVNVNSLKLHSGSHVPATQERRWLQARPAKSTRAREAYADAEKRRLRAAQPIENGAGYLRQKVASDLNRPPTIIPQGTPVNIPTKPQPIIIHCDRAPAIENQKRPQDPTVYSARIPGIVNISAATQDPIVFSWVRTYTPDIPSQNATWLREEVGLLKEQVAPIGAVVAYAGDKLAPSNWMVCDGRAMKSSEYPDLFKAIGQTYGNGLDADAHLVGDFNLPDFRGRFLRGLDNIKEGPNSTKRDPDRDTRVSPVDGKRVVGGVVGSVQPDDLKNHFHTLHTTKTAEVSPPWEHRDGFAEGAHGDGGPPDNGYGKSLGDGGKPGNETRPVNQYVIWVIRAK